MKKTVRKCFVYALIDPRHPERYRYIGVTHRSLKMRCKEHAEDTKNTAKTTWIRGLITEGFMPEIVQLHVFDMKNDVEWRKIEAGFIKTCKSAGHPIQNSNVGGGGRCFPKKHAGRPRLPKNQRKIIFKVCLTDKDRNRWKEIAQKSGLSPARWLSRELHRERMNIAPVSL